jgi:hypothetical protein
MARWEHPSDLELVEWADGDLSVAKGAALGGHIGNCPRCQALLEGRQPPPADLQARLMRGTTVPGLSEQLVDALAGGGLDPVAGQLWQLEWGDLGAVGLIVGADQELVTVVPADDDPHLGDEWTVKLERRESPVGLAFALWTGLAAEVPIRSLNALLGVVPASTMTRVEAALQARQAGLASAPDSVGAPVMSVLDERDQVKQAIAERFAALEAATWLPATQVEPVDIGALLRERGLQATTIAEQLGMQPSEVLKLVRRQRGLSAEERRQLAELLGIYPSLLHVTVRLPPGLVTALDHPRRCPRLRAGARAAGTSEGAFRWSMAQEVLPMAARTFGSRGSEPNWEQLVEDRLRDR